MKIPTTLALASALLLYISIPEYTKQNIAKAKITISPIFTRYFLFIFFTFYLLYPLSRLILYPEKGNYKQ